MNTIDRRDILRLTDRWWYKTNVQDDDRVERARNESSNIQNSNFSVTASRFAISFRQVRQCYLYGTPARVVSGERTPEFLPWERRF
jgi:hypothetical protein